MIRSSAFHLIYHRIQLLLLVVLFAATSAVAHAQSESFYNESVQVGTSGTLKYQLEVQTGYCGSSLQTSADMWQNFSFTPTGGTATSLGGSIDYIFPCGYYDINGGWDYETNTYSSDGWSNDLTLSPSVTINGENCTIDFYASEGGGGSPSMSCVQPVTGYVDLRNL